LRKVYSAVGLNEARFLEGLVFLRTLQERVLALSCLDIADATPIYSNKRHQKALTYVLDQQQSKEVARSNAVPVPPPGMNNSQLSFRLSDVLLGRFSPVGQALLCSNKYNSNRQYSVYSLLFIIAMLVPSGLVNGLVAGCRLKSNSDSLSIHLSL